MFEDAILDCAASRWKTGEARRVAWRMILRFASTRPISAIEDVTERRAPTANDGIDPIALEGRRRIVAGERDREVRFPDLTRPHQVRRKEERCGVPRFDDIDQVRVDRSRCARLQSKPLGQAPDGLAVTLGPVVRFVTAGR